MNATGKLAVFGLAVAAVAGAGWMIGDAVGPAAAPKPESHASANDGHASPEGGHADEGHGGAELPGGLMSSLDGYTFAPDDRTLRVGEQPFAFRILGPDGEPVTEFELEHEKRLHLIVVRRDTSGFQHLHPELRADGTWTVPLELRAPGTYRAYADFRPSGGEPLTLGVDLEVPGKFEPRTFEPSRVSTVDGYRVELDGHLHGGGTSDVTLSVSRGGKPVHDLQPYLGAAGHLVALRDGDLAYLHVHPKHGGHGGDSGPEIRFGAEIPSAGTYRLFLDFKHDGKVRTAEFTVTAGEGHG